jgi:hypothetical protein
MFGERLTREDSVPGRIRKRPRQLTRARPSLGRKRPRRGAVLKEPQLPGVRGGVGGQSSRGHVPRTPHQSFSEGPHQVSDITEAGSRNVWALTHERLQNRRIRTLGCPTQDNGLRIRTEPSVPREFRGQRHVERAVPSGQRSSHRRARPRLRNPGAAASTGRPSPASLDKAGRTRGFQLWIALRSWVRP